MHYMLITSLYIAEQVM